MSPNSTIEIAPVVLIQGLKKKNVLVSMVNTRRNIEQNDPKEAA